MPRAIKRRQITGEIVALVIMASIFLVLIVTAMETPTKYLH